MNLIPSLRLTLQLCALGSAGFAADVAPFAGARLAVLSDGAMLASGYVDTQLGPPVSPVEDTLTLLQFDAEGHARVTASVPVSNSVAGWPNCLDVSPDGRFAIVAETFGPRPASARVIADIPPGAVVSVIDLAAGRVVQSLELGPHPSRVAFHPGGAWVLVTRNGGDHPITLLPFREGRLGAPIAQPAANAVVAGGPAPEFRWHPSGQFAAVTLPATQKVAFFRLRDLDSATPMLEPWGNQPATGVTPGIARWTHDGRHLLVTNLNWDEDVEESWGLEDNQSTIMAYRFDDGSGEASARVPVRRFRDEPSRRPAVHHARVANIAVGAAAENLVVSPDGRWVVTLNMETSFLPPASPAYAPHSSLSLLEFDGESGRLRHHSTTPFVGVLPEGIVFARDGLHLAIATFDHHDPTRRGGSIDFWRLVPGPQPTLARLPATIDVPRGAHVVELIP